MKFNSRLTRFDPRDDKLGIFIQFEEKIKTVGVTFIIDEITLLTRIGGITGVGKEILWGILFFIVFFRTSITAAAAAVQQTFGCNCQGTPKKPETCPILPGIGCLIDNVVYRATVTRTDTNQVETYTGSTAQTMKGRWSGHDSDNKHPKHFWYQIHSQTHKTRNWVHIEC